MASTDFLFLFRIKQDQCSVGFGKVGVQVMVSVPDVVFGGTFSGFSQDDSSWLDFP